MTERRAAYHAGISEHAEQCALFERLAFAATKYPELALAFAIPNGGKRHIATAIRLKAEGVKSGVPDICLPVARQGYHGLFVELKAGRNRPSDKQEGWLERLCEQGYLAVACWGQDDAWETICDYLGITESGA